MMNKFQRAAKTGVNAVKPAVRSIVRTVARYPEVAVYGGLGYLAGAALDRAPVVGWLMAGNGKWIGGAAGAIYGHNKALLRRRLDALEHARERTQASA